MVLYASPPFLTLWSHYPNWTKNLLSISQLLRTCHILIRYQCHHYWHFLQIKIILTLNVNTLIMATRFPVPGPSKASNVIRHKGFSFRKNLMLLIMITFAVDCQDSSTPLDNSSGSSVKWKAGLYGDVWVGDNSENPVWRQMVEAAERIEVSSSDDDEVN